MKTVTTCDDYQTLFHVICPPYREAVWHIHEILYRTSRGVVLNYTDLLGHSGEATALCALVHPFAKGG